MTLKFIRKFSEILTVILIVAALTGCATPQSPATPTVAGCRPSQVQASENGLPEIQGSMRSDGELWALLFFDKARTGEEVKIVWRITGEGEKFLVEAKQADGTSLSPAWGPQYHESSTWKRPGSEWGTGFKFPKPGCWTLTATYGTTSGEIYLDVLAAP